MYIEAVPNRSSPSAILLRESYRQDGKARKRTLCNLSDWPTAHIEGLRGVLRGGTVISAEHDAFSVPHSLPHGHVAAALDWLLERQPAIEATLAKRHLTHGTLVLYDVSSSYMEGRCCPLAKRGYSRDGRKGTLQIVYGLLCAPDGCPVAIEVFEGNTADPMTLASRVEKLKQRFHLDHVVLVGDRGMITQARVTEDIKSAGLDWITAPRAPAIKALLASGALQLSLLDQCNIASITAPGFPNERLVVCRNPDLAAERAREREDLLAATERDLVRIQAAVAGRRDPLRGTAEIAIAVGAVINRHKMKKHFDPDITNAGFRFSRKIATEAASDGIYVVRTSLPAQAFDDAATVCSYKSLALVERAFLCMLANCLEWHMRQRLAPMLFDDTDKEAAEALHKSVVAQAQCSPAAVKKQTTGLTEDGLPVHSFRSLLADLATLAGCTAWRWSAQSRSRPAATRFSQDSR
jgi:hypothetical protein